MTWILIAVAIAATMVAWSLHQDRQASRKRPPMSSTSKSPTALPSNTTSSSKPARHIPPNDPSMADIERLVNANQLIPAIKAYRQAFGVSLTEASQAIKEIRLRQRR